jgi:hypothetical protein
MVNSVEHCESEGTYTPSQAAFVRGKTMVKLEKRSTGEGNPRNRRARGTRSLPSCRFDRWFGGNVVLLNATNCWGLDGLVTINGEAVVVEVAVGVGKGICKVEVDIGTIKWAIAEDDVEVELEDIVDMPEVTGVVELFETLILLLLGLVTGVEDAGVDVGVRPGRGDMIPVEPSCRWICLLCDKFTGTRAV